MDTAVRPDLHPPPVQAKRERPVGASFSSSGVVQRKLKLTGEEANVNRAVQLLNSSMFGYTASADRNGYVALVANDTVGPPSPEQVSMYERLKTVIDDPNDVTVKVDANNPAIIGGGYAAGTINMDDIDLFGREGGMTSQGVMIHELVEQYHKQIHGTGYGGEGHGAHGEAILAENDVNGSVRGTQRTVSFTDNGDGTFDAVIEVPYTFPDGRKVTTVLTIARGDLTHVEHRGPKKASQ